ncbi:hypothetical protein Dsin_017078 [Dipteronia sinensis]|uniref:Scarecrow-like protein 3 n=1 Tax=Dipteronia sinensis TaxID=43782 RepID=A0AAE0AFM5_9ROSI|nr:hypothetical protein Dsin_017078 [Dipteronia sinensis]
MSSLRPPLLKPDVTLSLALPPCPSPQPQEALKPEERGIHLIQLLLTCAKHASSSNLHRADDCLRQISKLASVTGDSMQRLSARFASALAVLLVKRWPGLYKALNQNNKYWPKQEHDRARRLFYQSFPYLGFSYAIMAQTLFHLMTDERVIHVIDLGSGDPKFWVPLMSSLSSLAEAPPNVKVTCVNGNKHVLDKLGPTLVKEAEALDMPFQFNPINVNLRDLSVDMLKVRSGEALALISVLNLHALLAEDDRVDAHFGINNNKSNNVKDCKKLGQFLGMIRSIAPKLFFLVEQEADHNLNRLVDRFVEGLHYYSAIFDAIDATFESRSSEERLILEEMFGREIENIVANEGIEREQRHERYGRWMVRFGRAGFKPVQLWVDPKEHVKQMAEGYGNKDGYKIINERASLMICWYDRPLYAVSAWTC